MPNWNGNSMKMSEKYVFLDEINAGKPCWISKE